MVIVLYCVAKEWRWNASCALRADLSFKGGQYGATREQRYWTLWVWQWPDGWQDGWSNERYEGYHLQPGEYPVPCPGGRRDLRQVRHGCRVRGRPGVGTVLPAGQG